MLCCFPCTRKSKNRVLEDDYEVLQEIGAGKTGKVYRCCQKLDKNEVAVKIVRHDYLITQNRLDAIENELAILAHVHHPSIIRLHAVYRDEDAIAIVTEKANGGEIMDYWYSHPKIRVSEHDISLIVREIASTLVYLHGQGITHRDLKVENVLWKKQNDMSAGIYLIDFGLAHQGAVGSTEMAGMNGTSHYLAPETFGKHSRYGSKVDIWSLGVLTYVLLFGSYPFDAKFLSQLEDKIQSGQFDFPPSLQTQVSPQAKQFIKDLLVINPEQRPSAELVLRHPWLQPQGGAFTHSFSDVQMQQLHAFVASQKKYSTV